MNILPKKIFNEISAEMYDFVTSDKVTQADIKQLRDFEEMFRNYAEIARINIEETAKHVKETV